MPRPRPRPSSHPVSARALITVLGLATSVWVASAGPAAADTTLWAFPALPDDPADGDVRSCLPVNPLCVIGEAAQAAVTDVWVGAMLSLWEAGLWLLGLAFSVVDALTTPDLSAGGPLAAIYPVTFGIGATVAVVMALTQQIGRAHV